VKSLIARRTIPLLTVLALTACGDSRDELETLTTGLGEETGDAQDEDGEDGEDGGNIKFDTPEGMEGGDDGGQEEGCTKVDFLFVIDHSGSMDDDQQNLINNFPGFMEAIQETLEIEDFHVMVNDTDAGGMTHPDCYAWWEEQGDPWHITPCPYPAVPAGADPDLLDLWDACDGTIGAGVDMPLGFEASNLECKFANGKRYIDASEPDLSSAFSCAARLGIGGNNSEKPAEALVSSVSPELQGPGGCNEGFIRDDALLVVTMLTDEQDVTSKPKAAPDQWAQAVINAKAGKEQHVVMLGLFGDITYPAPYLQQMVETFTHGKLESVLIPDYRPFFESAVADIEIACDEFVPEG
jgi:hypothetical protein